jgi:hypothetical protein
MANWLLFSAGLVAAFYSRVAKISRCLSAHVQYGRSGTAVRTNLLQEYQKKRVGQVII